MLNAHAFSHLSYVALQDEVWLVEARFLCARDIVLGITRCHLRCPVAHPAYTDSSSVATARQPSSLPIATLLPMQRPHIAFTSPLAFRSCRPHCLCLCVRNGRSTLESADHKPTCHCMRFLCSFMVRVETCQKYPRDSRASLRRRPSSPTPFLWVNLLRDLASQTTYESIYTKLVCQTMPPLSHPWLEIGLFWR